MSFVEPTLTLRFGSGVEATKDSRDRLQAMRLQDAGLPSWDAVLASYPAFTSATVVFVSGSVTQGWGHANSDLDLFVLSDEPIQVNDDKVEFFEDRVATTIPTIRLAIGQVAHFRADIELWQVEQLEELLCRFEGQTPDQEGAELGRTEKELLYRLSVGLPLQGRDRWAEWKMRLLASSYGLWLAENRKLSAEGMLEDAAGMLTSGDTESAVLAAREAFVLVLEAALSVAGDYSSSRKWLYRRVVAKPLEVLPPQEAWRWLTMVGTYDNPQRWAADVVEVAHRLLLTIETRAGA